MPGKKRGCSSSLSGPQLDLLKTLTEHSSTNYLNCLNVCHSFSFSPNVKKIFRTNWQIAIISESFPDQKLYMSTSVHQFLFDGIRHWGKYGWVTHNVKSMETKVINVGWARGPSPRMWQVLDSSPSTHKTGLEVQICNPSSWEEDMGRSVQGHLWLYREFEASLSYMRSCLKKTKVINAKNVFLLYME